MPSCWWRYPRALQEQYRRRQREMGAQRGSAALELPAGNPRRGCLSKFGLRMLHSGGGSSDESTCEASKSMHRTGLVAEACASLVLLYARKCGWNVRQLPRVDQWL